MARVDDPERLRRLLEGAYDRIGVLEEALDTEKQRRTAERTNHAARADAAEADLQMAKARGERLSGVVRDIVNNPTSQRADVQGKLLVALEVWDGRRP